MSTSTESGRQLRSIASGSKLHSTRTATMAIIALFLIAVVIRAWLSFRIYDVTAGHLGVSAMGRNVLPTPLDPENWYGYMFGRAAGKLNVSGENVIMTIYQSDTINWHYQYGISGVKLREGARYVLTFRARADYPHDVTVSTPSVSPNIHVDNTWRDYRIAFQATHVDPNGVNVPQFQAGAGEGRFWISDLRVVEAN